MTAACARTPGAPLDVRRYLSCAASDSAVATADSAPSTSFCMWASSEASGDGEVLPAAGAEVAGSTSPSPDASELAHMQKLVDGAESAVATAESDAAQDK